MNRRILAAALSGALLLAACGSDDDGEITASATGAANDPPTAAPPADAAADTIAVTAADYTFDGLPSEATVGTSFTLTNTSGTELHEIVALRLHDGEERPLGELLQLPDDERAQVGEVVGVTVAPPGGDGFAPNGPWTLTEPGRYVLVCMIPQGASPEEYLAAAQAAGGPPEVEGGPPHAALGMVAELTVR